jgi:hypothetical protein
MSKRQFIWAVTLTTLAWGIGSGLSSPPAAGWIGGLDSSQRALAWLVGGLLTGLVLRWTTPMFRWRFVLVLGLGWALAGWLQRTAGLAAGSLITVLILRHTSPRVEWLHSLIILIGWVVGGALSLLVESLPPATILPVLQVSLAVISGLIAGLVGGAATFWALRLAEWGAVIDDPHTWTIPALIRTLDDNPVMERLIGKRLEKEIYVITGAAFGVGLLALLVSMSVWGRIKGYFTLQSTVVPLLIYLVTLAPTARSPLVVASIAALLTAADADKQQFQLLRLTPISEREVTWAYSVAPLRMLRGLLTFEYIVMLLMLTGAMCAFLPSFPTVDREVFLATMVAMLMLAVGLVGMNILAAAVGVRAALWLREKSLAAVIAPMGMLMVILLVLLLAVNGLQVLASAPTVQVGVGFMLLMVAPYVAAVELMDHTQPWRDVPGGTT